MLSQLLLHLGWFAQVLQSHGQHEIGSIRDPGSGLKVGRNFAVVIGPRPELTGHFRVVPQPIQQQGIELPTFFGIC